MKCSVLYYWSSAGFFRVYLNHERPHPLFSVFLVISFLVLFVLLVLRVWVNSSYCQSRETLFKTLNKVCYKKSLRMFHFGVLTISRASSQLLFSFSCLVCLFPGFWWWNLLKPKTLTFWIKEKLVSSLYTSSSESRGWNWSRVCIEVCRRSRVSKQDYNQNNALPFSCPWVIISLENVGLSTCKWRYPVHPNYSIPC